MLGWFRDYQQNREIQKRALAFYDELKENLENYYVMFQINRLRPFKLDAWEALKSRKDFVSVPSLERYGRRLGDYQACQKDFKEYEDWYTADLARKTQETGRILHQKKSCAEDQFRGLEDVIISALAEWEETLKEQKFLRPEVSAIRPRDNS